MAHPLPLSYHWQTPVLVASAGAFACVGFVLRGSAPGRWTVAAVVVGLWLAFVVLVFVRTRAYLMVDGTRLQVRSLRTTHLIECHQVVGVRRLRTVHGPSYRLGFRGPDGTIRHCTAPVALLRGGSTALFGWLSTNAPQAELDRASARTLERLRGVGGPE